MRLRTLSLNATSPPLFSVISPVTVSTTMSPTTRSSICMSPPAMATTGLRGFGFEHADLHQHAGEIPDRTDVDQVSVSDREQPDDGKLKRLAGRRQPQEPSGIGPRLHRQLDDALVVDQHMFAGQR